MSVVQTPRLFNLTSKCPSNCARLVASRRTKPSTSLRRKLFLQDVARRCTVLDRDRLPLEFRRSLSSTVRQRARARETESESERDRERARRTESERESEPESEREREMDSTLAYLCMSVFVLSYEASRTRILRAHAYLSVRLPALLPT